MQVYRSIQTKRDRKPMLNPKPANDTRWNARQDEARRANEIMGDLCSTFEKLLAPDGDDYNLLSDKEKETGDISAYIYSDWEKMLLRQFEAAAMGAKYFSKFTQEKSSSPAYVLLNIQLAIKYVSGDYLEMHSSEYTGVACCVLCNGCI
jgi:hypothetical protein